LSEQEETSMGAFLEGEKVILRGVRREDLKLYREWLDNPSVTKFLEMGWKPTSEQDLDAAHASLSGDADNIAFVIVDRESGDPVGVCGLYLISWVARRAQFNILIGEPSAWDKGFGTQALSMLLDYGFGTLNLESVNLGVNSENKRAQRSYEKAGFVTEGRRRKFIYRNAQYYDLVVMSILREEYLAN
jgi:RimJ/RimL family protein N-acetyltransferase